MEGSNLSSFLGQSPQKVLEMLEYNINELLSDTTQIYIIYKQFIEETLKNIDFIKKELSYPNSLSFFILKAYAPFLNFYIHEHIQDILIFDFTRQYLKEDYDVPSNLAFEVYNQELEKIAPEKLQQLKDRLLTLYARNKLPITQKTLTIVSNLLGNRLSDATVVQYLNFIPLNYILPDTIEINDPINPLDPCYITEFECEGFVFYSTIHCIYFCIFNSLIEKKDSYRLLLKNPVKKIQSYDDFISPEVFNFDEIYSKIYNNKLINILKSALDYKFQQNMNLYQLLLETEKNGVTEYIYMDPYDPILGYNEKLAGLEGNFMNQTGKYILQLRTILSQETKAEYGFFYDLCGDNLFLHTWLKRQLVYIRVCLIHFKRIYKTIDMKNVKVFFAKIFRPYHTIYRF
jgi:hypothetical protein